MSTPSTRNIAPGQWQKFEQNIEEIFAAFGLELGTPGTTRTPERFLRALYDATCGYDGDPTVATTFPIERIVTPENDAAQVIEGPIHFYALCEHHAFPFFGTVHVGYIPNDQIIGISKLTRLVRVYARRFTVQERMGQEIIDKLVEIVQPRGAAIVVTAGHLCAQMRGVREPDSRTTTTVWRGAYASDPHLRQEFISTWQQK